jgi:hypothetical protein
LPRDARAIGSNERENVADFAVAVLEAWQKRGIATVLGSALMSFVLERGFKTFTGDVLPESEGMLKLRCRRGSHACFA